MTILTTRRLRRCFVWGVAAHIWGFAFLSGADFDDGLVAYYPFEGSDQQFEDAGKNSLDSNGKTATDQLTRIQPPLRLGSCCGLAGFVGILDELRIYDRTLDDQEIEQLFGHNPGAFSVSPVSSLSTTWGDLKTANQDAKDR